MRPFRLRRHSGVTAASRLDAQTPGRQLRMAAAALAVAAAVALVAGPADASSPSPSAPGYPSWQDVQNAMHDQQAAQAEVTVLEAALKTAQAESATRSQEALDAAAAADQAQTALDAATAAAASLTAQASAASASAESAAHALAVVAAGRYRAGSDGTIVAQVLASHDPDALLGRLSVLGRLTTTWNGIAQQASAAANTAASLRDQAARAEAARTTLNDAAQTKAAAAKQAEQAADAAVVSAQQHTDTLYAQLATLKNTTTDVERRYEIGVQVAAQAAAQAAAAAAAAQRSSHGSGGSDDYPSTDGVVADPAGAKAYARGAIGGYGWGSDQYSCLLSLWTMESGWRANALNTSSGAYGIPQALPANKMATAGADWRTNGATQIDWGLAYIKARYGSPCGAWAHEMSENPHWY
jgi:septal ring factor EnvC (AmiA/AmiB activator)